MKPGSMALRSELCSFPQGWRTLADTPMHQMFGAIGDIIARSSTIWLSELTHFTLEYIPLRIPSEEDLGWDSGFLFGDE